MSTNQTKNLHLHSWDPLDRFTREEFNDNWAGIDAAWGDLDGRILADVEALSVETAARKAADTTLQKNIDAKAAATALATETTTRANADAALEKRATALESRVAALETQMTQRPRIVSGSYKGNGSDYENSSQEINLGFRPIMVIVTHSDTYVSAFNQTRFAASVAGQDITFLGPPLLTITDTGFIAHNSKAGGCMNSLNRWYYYTALY